MNIVLLAEEDFIDSHTAIIHDLRRCEHIRSVHQAKPGDSLKVGLLNGKLGHGKLQILDSNKIILSDIVLPTPAPAALPLTLLLGLPRPKMLKRILQTLATLGAKKIFLINSYRVEKSYWQTPWLTPNAIREQFILGLEQGCDTQLPELTLVKRFKPFVEDTLPEIIKNTRPLVAHPYTSINCPAQTSDAITLAIGPEGGFIPYEISMLENCGFESVHLGKRIMRVETAVPFILGRLFQ